MSRKDARAEALKDLYAELDKQVGEGAGRPIPEHQIVPIERVPTGSFNLDIVTGGGMPSGRIIEMYGNESSGKTTLALSVMAMAQKAGHTVAYIDVEHSLDLEWAQKLGLDISTMLYHAPDTGEQALTVADVMIASGQVKVVVVDSVSALVPRAELVGEVGESHMGLQARLMSQICRKLAGPVSRAGAILIFINQLRDKIGVVYGSPETTSGGKALKFFASIRLDIRRGESLKRGDEIIGHRIKVKTVKNKTAPPYRTAQIPILYGIGLSQATEILEAGIEAGLVKKAGSWYAYKDTKLGQGLENAVATLTADAALLEELTREVRALP